MKIFFLTQSLVNSENQKPKIKTKTYNQMLKYETKAWHMYFKLSLVYSSVGQIIYVQASKQQIKTPFQSIMFC